MVPPLQRKRMLNGKVRRLLVGWVSPAETQAVVVQKCGQRCLPQVSWRTMVSSTGASTSAKAQPCKSKLGNNKYSSASSARTCAPVVWLCFRFVRASGRAALVAQQGRSEA